MTRKDYIDAAKIVKNILDGRWTEDRPEWADRDRYDGPIMVGTLYRENERYTRACQTAEAFVIFFSEDNPAFDAQRFLIACGLAKTIKRAIPSSTRATPTRRVATRNAQK